MEDERTLASYIGEISKSVFILKDRSLQIRDAISGSVPLEAAIELPGLETTLTATAYNTSEGLHQIACVLDEILKEMT